MTMRQCNRLLQRALDRGIILNSSRRSLKALLGESLSRDICCSARGSRIDGLVFERSVTEQWSTLHLLRCVPRRLIKRNGIIQRCAPSAPRLPFSPCTEGSV